jgi:hypothetical protein
MSAIINYETLWPDEPVALSFEDGVDSTDHDITTVTYTDGDAEAAYFTVGCKTVTVQGQPRTFTEQKRLFSDTFDRTVVDNWGPSPAGGTWGNVNGAASAYQVASGVGTIAPSVAVSHYMRLSDDLIGPCVVRTKVKLSNVPSGAANSAALLLAYQDNANNYRLRLTFNTSGTVVASIAKAVADVETSIASASTIGTGYTAGDYWWIEGQLSSTGAIQMYAWKDGTTKPGSPTRTGTDGSFTWTTGRIGLRVLLSTGASANTFTFDEYTFVSGQWTTAPSVTHSTWVRLLDEPYDGTMTTPLLNQVRAWLADSSPDILAIGMEYVGNACVATDSTLTNKQTKGEAAYGPMTAGGGRDEGADFNDYIGISYVYPVSGDGTTDAAEVAELHALDCSGLHRMMWGYRGGLPLTRSNATYFDGENLPRVSRDQASDGPGIVIVEATDAVPDLTDLRIGDALFWDASNGGDEEANELDHVGTYYGSKRFISSRKSPNGPTIADLGGASLIDSGSNLYTTRLRKIRRY